MTYSSSLVTNKNLPNKKNSEKRTWSKIASTTSSDRDIPDSVSVVKTMYFTYASNYNKGLCC